jgi:hypothetical protein
MLLIPSFCYFPINPLFSVFIRFRPVRNSYRYLYRYIRSPVSMGAILCLITLWRKNVLTLYLFRVFIYFVSLFLWLYLPIAVFSLLKYFKQFSKPNHRAILTNNANLHSHTSPLPNVLLRVPGQPSRRRSRIVPG